MFWNWGVDLEAQGCRLHDVQHAAALLDEHRRRFALNVLAEEFLGRGKFELPTDVKICEMSAGEVGPYAENDARLVSLLKEHLAPKVAAEDLGRVLELEDALIYATCEMERNGAPIDVAKLNLWRAKVRSEYQDAILAIYAAVKLRVNPNSGPDLARLFQELGLQYDSTLHGRPSFTSDFLETIDHPTVQLALRARKLGDINSKYLDKYAHQLGGGSILRYKLWQLRTDQYGTITGRYASSSINIQQVFSVERNEAWLPDYVVRELFLPAPGRVFVSADANQIEFRLFAHFSGSRRLIDAYCNDPTTDFHQVVAEIVSISRKPAKNINFAKLFGGGLDKIAEMLKRPAGEVAPLVARYEEEFPEAKTLMNRATRIAERRGYVKTLLGRRGRFPERERTYSALNKVIQGTAADIMKLKLLAVYRERKTLGLTLRYPVHDELAGDLEDPGRVGRLKELLDEPSLAVAVPIVWNVKTGKNWREVA
jgi:DNA polymerase-1